MKFLFEENNAIEIIGKFENASADIKYFNGKFGEILPEEDKNLIYFGFGKKENLNGKIIISAFRKLGSFCNEYDIKDLKLDFQKNEFLKAFILEIAEGFFNSGYSFDRYKSEKIENKLQNVYFVNFDGNIDDCINDIKKLKSVINYLSFTKDLVNMRSNEIYPATFAKRIYKELSACGASVDIYNREKIEKIGMEAFLSVARGSNREPKLIVMKYFGADKEKPIAFVGKGITYDSGGYSIKQSDGMKTMHNDMAGAAAVAGAIAAIAKNKLKINIVGIVAACENLISGRSYKPGDVIKSLSGKTIEVDNTDAEGRVTLADAVYYAADKFDPKCLIDLATLTGAAIIALGHEYTAIISNNQKLVSDFESAAKISNEKVWELPNDPEFKKLNHSKVADVKNVGGRAAGTITAGLFISEFNKNYPWLHCDIAGTSYLEQKNDLDPEGATGAMVKTLYNFAEMNARDKADED